MHSVFWGCLLSVGDLVAMTKWFVESSSYNAFLSGFKPAGAGGCKTKLASVFSLFKDCRDLSCKKN